MGLLTFAIGFYILGDFDEFLVDISNVVVDELSEFVKIHFFDT